MAVADPHAGAVREAVARALAEDLTPLGDITSALLPVGATAVAHFVPRAEGVLAGVACAGETFAQLDPAVELTWAAADGDRIAAGQVIGTVSGSMASILTGERTALNFLCHLSGIASFTRRFADAASAGGTARIWDTRKTTPGLRTLQKAAVRAGGAVNHSGNLSEWVMLKDNHLALPGSVASIPQGERTSPNLLGHPSVIGSVAVSLAESACAGGTARIWDTRKTTPGLRTLQKAAVRAGGAVNHRGNLSEWVMFKDNHLALLGITEAVAAAKATWPGKLVHVEATNTDELTQAQIGRAHV